jgi:hypothetical protein
MVSIPDDIPNACALPLTTPNNGAAAGVPDGKVPNPVVAGVLVASGGAEDDVLEEPNTNVADGLPGVAVYEAGLAAPPKPNDVCDGGGTDGVKASVPAGGNDENVLCAVVDGSWAPNVGPDRVLDPNDGTVVLLEEAPKTKGAADAALGCAAAVVTGGCPKLNSDDPFPVASVLGLMTAPPNDGGGISVDENEEAARE